MTGGSPPDRRHRIHLVAPRGFDDPQRPSGGNVYDRELAAGLRDLGHEVTVLTVPGLRPPAGLAETLAEVPDGEVAVVDGLVGLAAGAAVERERHRIRVWLLVHLPLGLEDGAGPAVAEAERRALSAAAGVVATSAWTRDWLLATYALDARQVHVATPGSHPAPLAPGSAHGGRLLCVGAVVPAKGQDVLAAALAGLPELLWTCWLVGPLDRAPRFVTDLRERAEAARLGVRVRLTGPLPPSALATAYDAADLVVLPTRLETFGMVVTEALARGIPVLASEVGGVPEALGSAPTGDRPGVLVPPGDPAALGVALRCWLTDPSWRQDLRDAARGRRQHLGDWATTARRVSDALGSTAAAPVAPPASPATVTA